MSGYLPIRDQKSQEYISSMPARNPLSSSSPDCSPCSAISEKSKDTPLLMCHGNADNVVRYEWGLKSFELLQSGTCTFRGLRHQIHILALARPAGLTKTKWKMYPGMGHSACVEELSDIQEFLAEVLPPIEKQDA